MNISFTGIPPCKSPKFRPVATALGLVAKGFSTARTQWTDLTAATRYRREAYYAQQVVRLCLERVRESLGVTNSLKHLSIQELLALYRNPAQRGLLDDELKQALSGYLHALCNYRNLRREINDSQPGETAFPDKQK